MTDFAVMTYKGIVCGASEAIFGSLVIIHTGEILATISEEYGSKLHR